jgi:DNA-binding transcriptional ArsR family regulator
MSHRPFKDRLYAEFATIGKALASAHRLELLDLLGQGERSVDELAQEIDQSLANTSAHLQVLRQARLVEADKRGLNVVYREWRGESGRRVHPAPGLRDIGKPARTVSTGLPSTCVKVPG